jgi:quercetin dioxygenase-like cupin family protein
MGITTLAFKVATADTGAGLFVIEQTNHAKGGPPRHVHPDQDEWFYVVAGEFVVEVGGTNAPAHRRGLAPRSQGRRPRVGVRR